MSGLKACPFCGSKAKKHKYTMLGEDFEVAYCPNEDCHFHHRTASVSDWNTRPIEDALDKRIAELELMVERLIEAGGAMVKNFVIYASLQGNEKPRSEAKNWYALVSEWKEREG